MIEAREDQAAGLRRLFRRSPPVVAALYAAGKNNACIAVQAVYRIASGSERVLLLDEATGGQALSGVLDLPEGPDLLGVLGMHDNVFELVQSVPGLVGRVPVSAAALALPLLDDERRMRLVSALRNLHRYAGFVLVHAECGSADDPSPFVFAAPRRLVVAEVSRSGAIQAYQVIKQLAAAGAGSLHVAVSGARGRQEAGQFFESLAQLVRRHVGVPLVWLGEIERDDICAGLIRETPVSPREAETAFLRRLAAMGRSGSAARYCNSR